MRLWSFLVCSLFVVLSSTWAEVSAPSLIRVDIHELADQFHEDSELWSRRAELMKAVLLSVEYLQGRGAENDYRALAAAGITRAQVLESLHRFLDILQRSPTGEEAAAAVLREFELLKSVGRDGRGKVKFTGYFQPVYRASRERTAQYLYPIFSLPEGFSSWNPPHPTRRALEGYRGDGAPLSPAAGHELAWFASRYEAFMVHLQGSAILELTGGERMSVGFAGATKYPFVGISPTFLRERGLGWMQLSSYFRHYPDELNQYLVRNNRFVFFKENPSPDPIGSLGVPVVSGRSIATDKSRMPPGALALIRTALPHMDAAGRITTRRSSRFVLDHDTGSAIKGAGRVDLFMGSGPEAKAKASQIFADGELYYLLLKQPSVL